LGEPTILVVDDTDRVRAVTADIRGGAGFKVREALGTLESMARELAGDATFERRLEQARSAAMTY
jgi:hypothetical protein